MKDYKTKTIDLNGDLKLINAVKKAGIKTYHPQGEFNGYGYVKLPLVAEITNLSEMRKFNKAKKIADSNPTKKKTEEEIREAWEKRFAKLTGISIEEAREIAEEKLDYKQQQIDNLNDRQCERYSVRRETLINKIVRSNPLRRIVDIDHAFAILEASNRHKYTDYEDVLQTAHELAAEGVIDKSEVKEYARTHYDRYVCFDDDDDECEYDDDE